MPTTQSAEYVASGNFVVPAGVSALMVTMIAGGGGGGSTTGILNFQGAGGGGSGEYCRRVLVKVTPGAVIPVVIGAGGIGAPVGNFFGSQGGASTFGTLVRVEGGWGGSPNGSAGQHTGCFASSGGNGGGRGGLRGNPEANCNTSGGNAANPGKIGIREGPWMYGGSGGGGGSLGGATAPIAVGFPGGGSEGRLVGGAGGTGYLTALGNYGGGGGGGGASPWGLGGRGGDGMIPPLVAFVGDGKVGVGYGSGGGGASAVYRSLGAAWVGGAGASGYCLLTWVA